MCPYKMAENEEKEVESPVSHPGDGEFNRRQHLILNFIIYTVNLYKEDCMTLHIS